MYKVVSLEELSARLWYIYIYVYSKQTKSKSLENLTTIKYVSIQTSIYYGLKSAKSFTSDWVEYTRLFL